MKVDVTNLKEDITKLKSQIVESPEELKSQMEKMRENVKNIKNSTVSRKENKWFEVTLAHATSSNELLMALTSDRNR